MLCTAFFLFCSFFNRVMFLFFPLSFLSFCSLLLCFLFFSDFYWHCTGPPLIYSNSRWLSVFFLLSNFVFLPYFCNFAFFKNIFLCSVNSDLNWCSLFISLLFSLYFSCFFFNFLVVCFSFFFVELLFVVNLLLFLNFHLVCLLNVFHFL